MNCATKVAQWALCTHAILTRHWAAQLLPVTLGAFGNAHTERRVMFNCPFLNNYKDHWVTGKMRLLGYFII